MIVTMYLHGLNHLQGMQMIFSSLYPILTVKDQTLAKILTNLTENLKKKISSAKLVEQNF